MDESGIQNDLVALLIRLRNQFQNNRTLEALGLEVDLEVGRGVPGAPSTVIGAGARVARHGCCGKGSA